MPADMAEVQGARAVRPISLWGRVREALEDERILGYVLLSPALILILVFIAYPFVLGIWMSLTDKLVGTPGEFIGLGNYRRLFASDIFWTAFGNTLFFTTMATVFKAALGMWLAVLLNRKFKFARITRAGILLPFIVPTVLSTLAWLWMFDATFSVFNWVLRWLYQMEISLFGLRDQGELGILPRPALAGRWQLGDVFGDPGQCLARAAILCHLLPRRPPDHSTPELYDAADIDGATGWKKFWHVTLPMIKPVAIVVVVFSIVITFADFQLVYILTRGGPNNETHLLATLAYQLGMGSDNIGQGRRRRPLHAADPCHGDRLPALVSEAGGIGLNDHGQDLP